MKSSQKSSDDVSDRENRPLTTVFNMLKYGINQGRKKSARCRFLSAIKKGVEPWRNRKNTRKKSGEELIKTSSGTDKPAAAFSFGLDSKLFFELIPRLFNPLQSLWPKS